MPRQAILEQLVCMPQLQQAGSVDFIMHWSDSAGDFRATWFLDPTHLHGEVLAARPHSTFDIAVARRVLLQFPSMQEWFEAINRTVTPMGKRVPLTRKSPLLCSIRVVGARG